MTTQSVSSHENVFVKPRLATSLRRRFIETLIEWRRRMNSRRELACLSHADIKDIGYPARAEAEKAKPFWRA
jgi:uncharacterized protein YjiS (DUF1127 family)